MLCFCQCFEFAGPGDLLALCTEFNFHINSSLGAVSEIEAAIVDMAAHDHLQGETVFCHDLTHLCVMTHFEMLLFHHVLLVAMYVL
jgi:hypothetical protein